MLDGNGNYFTQANLETEKGGGYNQRMGDLQAHSVNLSPLQIQSVHQTIGHQSSYFERISQILYTSQVSSCMTTSLSSTQLAINSVITILRQSIELQEIQDKLDMK